MRHFAVLLLAALVLAPAALAAERATAECATPAPAKYFGQATLEGRLISRTISHTAAIGGGGESVSLVVEVDGEELTVSCGPLMAAECKSPLIGTSPTVTAGVWVRGGHIVFMVNSPGLDSVGF